MYEIWLVLNIVWEIAIGLWPLLLVASLLWLTLVVAAWRRPGSHWRNGLPLALAVGVLVTVVSVLLVPAWTRSSLSEMAYWVDWANLLALSAGFGAAAAVLAWPVLAMRSRPSPSSP